MKPKAGLARRPIVPDGACQTRTTLQSPFEEPPDYAAPPGTEPPLGVLLFNSKGDRGLFFKPSDGRYAYYTTGADGQMAEDATKNCSGDGLGRTTKATFRAMVYDDQTNLVITGDRHGVVSLFDPAQPCVAVAERPQLNLGASVPITDVTIVGRGRVAITQVGGLLHIAHFAATGFSSALQPTAFAIFTVGKRFELGLGSSGFGPKPAGFSSCARRLKAMQESQANKEMKRILRIISP